ncbi:MAG: HD-GYP domain-containing protein [Spirochaetes bacterium]|nr:HD-GYP domain-containing protein [Spirochaetota bacterium]
MTDYNLKHVDFHAFVDSFAKTVDAKDAYTAGHSVRVANLSHFIAQVLGLEIDYSIYIHIAAHLHDIGKVGVPDGILLKTRKLSYHEHLVMQEHCKIGYDILAEIPFLEDMAEIVFYHHEHFDGQGYPEGIAGDAIPLGSRIIAVADTYDAITTTRPYRKALSLDKAFQEIKNHSGTQFDPDVVQVFSKIYQDYHDFLVEHFINRREEPELYSFSKRFK